VVEIDALMIRVVHVLTRTNIGGPSVMLVDLLEGLNQSRFQQIVVRGTPDTAEGDYLSGRRLTSEVVTLGGLRRSIGVVSEIATLFRLVGTLRRLQPDIVHTHMAKAGVIGRLAAVIARVPIRIHTYHGHLLHGYFSPLVTRVFNSVERRLRRLTAHFFVVGEATRRDLVRERLITETSSTMIMPPARNLRVHDRAEARHRLGLPNDRVIVGFVGRLTAIKRPDRFLRLADSIPEATFVLVGNGPLRDQVVAQASTRVNVMVKDWADDIALVLSALDIVVLTSDNEGVPLSLIEAAVVGRPVVATAVGAISEIVDHGTTGYVVKDDEGLIDAVRRLVVDPELRKAMGSAAASRIGSSCSMESYLDAHATVYSRLLAE
jgi:glycosyltransferase involved in cell wall biosynthesis